MIFYLILIILDLGVNLTFLLVAFTIHITLELVSEETRIPLTTPLTLEHIFLKPLAWYLRIFAYYILLNHTNACSLIFFF
jgi:hypothetical protein